MSYVVPRFRSAMGRTGRVPLVEHPSSRAWKTEDLVICGTPTPVLRREQTLGGYPTHHRDLRTMDARYSVDDDSPRLLQYPPEYLQKPGRAKVTFQDTSYTKGASDSVLIGVIQDKLTNGYHAVKHMFRSNDPTGQGKVSRDGLLKIFYNLFGYITREQFENILRMLGLQRLNSISFDKFISCFKDNEVVQRQQVQPLQHISITENVQPVYCSPGYAIGVLKEKLHTGNVDIHNILPPACFLSDGYVVPPQLREALAQIGVRLCDDDFPKLWLKVDRHNVGAVQTSQLYRELDLDHRGQPKVVSLFVRNDLSPSAITRKRSEVVTSRTDWVDKYTQDPQSGNLNLQRTKTTVHQTEKQMETTECADIPALDPRTRHFQVVPKQKPTLDNVVDQLYYQFENAYHALLAAFKLFDTLGDGYIARVDFRRVLQQFGFNIAAVDLERFLARAGLRCIQGQVDYRDFLHKYQRRAADSLTAQVVASKGHCVHGNGLPAETSTAEQLEARIVEYLHSDYFNLLNQFRTLDKNNIGAVSQFDFRNALEKATCCQLTDTQWDRLKRDLGLGTSGALIDYQTFLQRFDTEPGSWNTRREGTYCMPRYPNVYAPPPQVDALRERAKSCHARVMDTNKTYADGTRSSPELQKQVHELLTKRADAFEKHFQEMDRKGTGRMTKWQFGALLKITGLSLSTRELDHLWNSMRVEADNMFSYNGLLQHFNSLNKPARSPTYRETSSAKLDASRVPPEKKDKEKQAELERIAKRAELDRLQREKQADQAARKAERDRKGSEKRESRPVTPFDTARMDELANAKLTSLYQQKVTSLLQKIKPQVLNQRDYLKTYFQTRDRMGFSHISVDEMKGIMDRLYFNLLEEEKKEVCRYFDLNGNGRFHYSKFLDTVSATPTSCDSVNRSNKCNTFLQRKHNYSVTVSHAKRTMQEKLLTEWKNLRRAFKKYDKNNDGLLDLADLKKVLRQCSVPFNNEDLYHILSEFDANMDGKISYDEFLKTLLTC